MAVMDFLFIIHISDIHSNFTHTDYIVSVSVFERYFVLYGRIMNELMKKVNVNLHSVFSV